MAKAACPRGARASTTNLSGRRTEARSPIRARFKPIDPSVRTSSGDLASRIALRANWSRKAPIAFWARARSSNWPTMTPRPVVPTWRVPVCYCLSNARTSCTRSEGEKSTSRMARSFPDGSITNVGAE